MTGLNRAILYGSRANSTAEASVDHGRIIRTADLVNYQHLQSMYSSQEMAEAHISSAIRQSVPRIIFGQPRYLIPVWIETIDYSTIGGCVYYMHGVLHD